MAINMGNAIAYLDLDASKFASGLSKIGKDFSQFMDKTETAGNRLNGLGNGLKSVGSSLTKNVTVPLAAVGTASVATAANFEKSMSQVAATMGITADEINNGSESFEKLEAAAKEMGATTQFSASQSAEALNYLALAGYDTETAIETLPTVLNLAAAGGIELGYASDVLTDAMSALGLETEEATNFVDEMAKTSQKSNTSVAQLGEAILTVGGTAKNLAGGTVELNAALGILADNGIKGAEGGTALRNIILAMTPSTDAAVAAFERLNVETYDANGNLKPLNETFGELDAALSTLSQEERTKVLSDIFNKADLKSANALLANSGERFNELSGYIDNANGAAADMADTMNNNLSGQLTLLKSGLEGAGIAIGEALLPLVKILAEGINNLVTWFNNLSPAIQTTIAIVGLLVAGIGPLLLIIGQVVIAIGGLITFFAAGGAGAAAFGAVMAVLTGPVGLVIAVITLLIATGVFLMKNWDEMKASAIVAFNKVKEVVQTTMGAARTFLETCWNAIKSVCQTVWSAIVSVITTYITNVYNNISTVWNTIVSITSTLWNATKSAISTVWNGIKSVVSTGVNLVKSTIQAVWNTLERILTAPFVAAKRVIDGILGGISKAIGAVTSGISKVTGMFKGKSIHGEDAEDYAVMQQREYMDYNGALSLVSSNNGANNYSLNSAFKDFAKEVMPSKDKGNSSNENTVNVNLNIDKFINETAQSVDELMDEIAFKLKRKSFI